jgi:hypothetical protein
MKKESLFIIIAVIISIWTLNSGALGASFEKNTVGKSRLILKINKRSKGAIAVQRSYRTISTAVGSFSDTAFRAVGGPELAQKCRNEPVLFGSLFIFAGVSACGIFFVVHLIRSDARFY